MYLFSIRSAFTKIFEKEHDIIIQEKQPHENSSSENEMNVELSKTSTYKSWYVMLHGS